MCTGGQARCCKDGVLIAFLRGSGKGIDRSHKASIHVYVSDAGGKFTAADPADRRPDEGERGLRARHVGFGDGPLTPSSIQIALNPAAAVDDGRIRLLE